jgi:hypothetical protein
MQTHFTAKVRNSTVPVSNFHATVQNSRPFADICVRGRICFTAALLVCFAGSIHAQQAVNQPSLVLSQALAALSGSSAVSQDALLSGDVEYVAGSQDEKGTVKLASNQSGMTRTEIDLPSENILETRRITSTGRAGEWHKGSTEVTSISLSLNNLFTDPAWFFPEHLISRQNTNSRALELPADPASTSAGTIHIRSYLPASELQNLTMLQKLSVINLYVNATSFLLDEVRFDIYSDKNARVAIPIRIVFSDYKTVSGHMVPYHIQRYVNGSLNADITITNVGINPGIALSEYTLQ